eukprot:scaffold320129_cov50-Prasinocladus_malaysianus.AAC.1
MQASGQLGNGQCTFNVDTFCQHEDQAGLECDLFRQKCNANAQISRSWLCLMAAMPPVILNLDHLVPSTCQRAAFQQMH